MSFPFTSFDRARTRAWIVVQVTLIFLIVAGVGLLATERYWLPKVVLFLLAHEQSSRSNQLPENVVPISTPVESPLLPSTPTKSSVNPNPASSMNTSVTTFSISVTAKIERGQTVTISWQLPEVPPDSSIGFTLSGKLFTPGSPLTLLTIPLTKASGSFVWNGEQYACDPNDHPTYCTGVPTGEYVITAHVYDKAKVSLVDGDRAVPIVHDEKVLYTASTRLVLGGLPGPERIDTFTQVVANKINTVYLHEANPLALWDSTASAQENRIKPYIHEQGPFTGPDAVGMFCMSFTLSTPFVGHFTVCGPDQTYTRDSAHLFKVTGDFTPVPDVVTYQVAKQKVLDTVWSLYEHRVAFKHMPTNEEVGFTGNPDAYKTWIGAHPNADTYLDTSIEDWAYRTDAGGYWVYKAHTTKNGSVDMVPDPFNDILIIRVDNSGAACVAQTYDYLNFTGTVLDIHTDSIVCPKVS
jgi:hypothetical protein